MSVYRKKELIPNDNERTLVEGVFVRTLSHEIACGMLSK